MCYKILFFVLLKCKQRVIQSCFRIEIEFKDFHVAECGILLIKLNIN